MTKKELKKIMKKLEERVREEVTIQMLKLAYMMGKDAAKGNPVAKVIFGIDKDKPEQTTEPEPDPVRPIVDEALAPSEEVVDTEVEPAPGPEPTPAGLTTWQQKVRYHVSRLGLKQNEFGEVAGIGPSSIGKYVMGKVKPRKEQQKLLRKAFRLTPEEAQRILHGEDAAPAPEPEPAAEPEAPAAEVPTSWAMAIRAHRKDVDMSVSEYADAVGVDRSSVLPWENNEYKPGPTNQNKLLAAGCVRPDLDAPKPAKAPDPNGPEPTAWPERIKYHRTRLGLSQKKFAMLLRVHDTSVYNWENRVNPPSNEMKQRLRNIFELTPAEAKRRVEVAGKGKDPKTPTRIGVNIKKTLDSLQKKFNMNMEDLGTVIGVHRTSLNDYKAGRSNPHPTTLAKITRAGKLSRQQAKDILRQRSA